ncbi:MAG: hypothetical protein KKD77_23485 [Gammaproteobacteria bacterium]|nr:hypothetical protein [Gammaproteobacteria bacterium]
MGDTANVLVGVAEITLGVGVDAQVIGYTIDGVNMSVRSEFFNAKVEENEGTIIRKLTDQDVMVTLNVAEGAIANLAAAIPGSGLVGATLTIGGEDLQATRLTLKGLNPAGHERVIVLTSVNPTGEVATPYKKGEVSVVPMQFTALVDDSSEFGEVYDAAAAAPTFVSAETNVGGTEIDVTLSGNMADPAGKHLEFWFTEAGVDRAFSAASVLAAVITLTVNGAAIASAPAAVKLYYALGTVRSVAGGVLESLTNETVTNNVP